jgi:hypothetical protein
MEEERSKRLVQKANMLKNKLSSGFVNRRKTQILGFKLLQVIQMDGGGEESNGFENGSAGAKPAAHRAHSLANSKYIQNNDGNRSISNIQ